MPWPAPTRTSREGSAPWKATSASCRTSQAQARRPQAFCKVYGTWPRRCREPSCDGRSRPCEFSILHAFHASVPDERSSSGNAVESDPMAIYIEQLRRTLPTWAERRSCWHGVRWQQWIAGPHKRVPGRRRDLRPRGCVLHLLRSLRNHPGTCARMQWSVQCLHQHTPLDELFTTLEAKAAAWTQAYLDYNAHVVCRTSSRPRTKQGRLGRSTCTTTP